MTDHPTDSVDVMSGCGVQWKGYSPGSSGAVKVAVSPGPTATSNCPPVSEVTVCPTLSSLRTVTVAPGAKVPLKEYSKSLIVISGASASIDTLGLSGSSSPEHPLSTAGSMARLATAASARTADGRLMGSCTTRPRRGIAGP